MGSFKFGRVADAVSEGAGLFAGRKVDEERDRIKRQWDLQMAELREKQDTGRELRQYAHNETLAAENLRAATERQAQTQQTAQSRDTATAQFREDTLAQNAEQFDRSQAAAEDKGLRTRLQALADGEAEERKNLDTFTIDAPDAQGMTASDRITADYGHRRDQAISNHVVRMSAANDGKGAPGYTQIKTSEDLASKMIQMGMDPGGADMFSGEMSPRLWPDLYGSSVGGGGGPGSEDHRKRAAAFHAAANTDLIPAGDPVADVAAAGIPQVAAPQVAAPAAGTPTPVPQDPNDRSISNLLLPSQSGVADFLGAPNTTDELKERLQGSRR